MVATTANQWDKLGIYTPDQASRLLGLRSDVVDRWIYGSNSGEAAVIPRFPEYNGEFITFVDLVQAMAIRAIRSSKKLSLQKIRATVEAANKHGIEYPFARKRTTYVFADDVVLRLNNGELIQATGKYKEQHLIEPIVELYLDDLGFDTHGLANIYTPLRRGYRQVVLAPNVNYGAPTILPTRYAVATLLNAVDAEGGIEAAASVCNVHQDDVRLAVDYEDSIRQAA